MSERSSLRNVAAALILLGACSGGEGGRPRSLRRGEIVLGGVERTFAWSEPAERRPGAPLLLVLHGSGGDGARVRALTARGFEQDDVVVVYPDGFRGYWNDARAAATNEANLRDVDDVGFLLALVDHFEAACGIDRERVFVFGFSNGGHMVYELAMVAAVHFRGFAVCAANLPRKDQLDVKPSGKPVSILIVNGTADPINPYGGGEVRAPDGRPRGAVLSAAATLAYWCDLAGAAGPGERRVLADGSVLVEHRGAGDERVAGITIERGGHAIPHPDAAGWPAFVGHVDRSLNTPREVLRFFRLGEAPPAN